MILDPIYIIVALPAMLLGMWAQMKTKSTFNKYSRYAASSRLTGAEAARRMLDRNGLHDVGIERSQGFLSDHYDPRTRTLRLSPPVYDAQSLSAIGVACHEAGHALQHASAYAPLHLRSTLVPTTQFGSQLAMPIFIAGLFLQLPILLKVGIFLFIGVVIFSLVTLPVEWNATARAKQHMVSAGIVTAEEQVHAGRVLNAAFMTYLASAISAITTLIYLILRSRR
jgi:Zn-dependent membrane protease YugP